MSAPYKLIMIESRTKNDVKMGNTEQELLGATFEQLNVRTKIIETNTPAEFYNALKLAESKHIYYVHFSGHGDSGGIWIANSFVSWADLDRNCWPSLKHVCLTFSSCLVAKGVKQLFEQHKTFCSAVVAATRKVTWPESAVAFSAFYLRATDNCTSTEQDVRVMNHICGRGTYKLFRASSTGTTAVLS